MPHHTYSIVLHHMSSCDVRSLHVKRKTERHGANITYHHNLVVRNQATQQYDDAGVFACIVNVVAEQRALRPANNGSSRSSTSGSSGGGGSNKSLQVLHGGFISKASRGITTRTHVLMTHTRRMRYNSGKWPANTRHDPRSTKYWRRTRHPR